MSEHEPEKMKLDELVNYVLSEFHETSREIISTIESILPIVVNKHGNHFPFLVDLNTVTNSLFEEYSEHLLKEENILFPYILNLVESEKKNQTPTHQMCGNISGPIHVMQNDHESIDHHLNKIKEITDNFIPPESACNKFRLVYQNLKNFYEDTVRHVHTENNILFPKAIQLEEKVCK